MPSCVVHPFVSHSHTFCQNEQTSSKNFHLWGTKRHGNIATGIACNVVVVRRWGVETDTKRGMKYPERIINSTKSATSLMFCGSASGEILPPYVVYKAEALWSTWTENAPPRCTLQSLEKRLVRCIKLRRLVHDVIVTATEEIGWQKDCNW